MEEVQCGTLYAASLTLGISGIMLAFVAFGLGVWAVRKARR